MVLGCNAGAAARMVLCARSALFIVSRLLHVCVLGGVSIAGCTRPTEKTTVKLQPYHDAPLTLLSQPQKERACEVLLAELARPPFSGNFWSVVLEGPWDTECLVQVYRAMIRLDSESAQFLASKYLIDHPDGSLTERLSEIAAVDHSYSMPDIDLLVRGALFAAGAPGSLDVMARLLRSPKGWTWSVTRQAALPKAVDLRLLPLIEQLLDDPKARSDAIDVYHQWVGCGSLPRISPYIDSADSGDRFAILRATASCPGNGRYVRALMNDKWVYLREVAMGYGLEAGDSFAVETLAASLPKGIYPLNWTAKMIATVKRNRASLAEPFNEYLLQPDRYLREDLVEAFLRAGLEPDSSRLEVAVREALAGSRKDEMARALQIVRLLKMTRLADLVENHLSSRQHSVRREAALTIGALASAHARTKLEKLLKEEYVTPVQLAALWSLGELGDPKAVRALKRFLRNPAPAVQAEAALSLMRLGECQFSREWMAHCGNWASASGLKKEDLDRRLCLHEILPLLEHPDPNVRRGTLAYVAIAPEGIGNQAL